MKSTLKLIGFLLLLTNNGISQDDSKIVLDTKVKIAIDSAAKCSTNCVIRQKANVKLKTTLDTSRKVIDKFDRVLLELKKN